jgi:hypothetical protein
MDCAHSQLMQCPNCKRIWCVPAIVGPAQVWHNRCGQLLDILLSSQGCERATRGAAVFFRESNRLEVQPDVERQ